jgi:metal-dependent amidase/aminoacylase/carboxypeptidase family protein
METGEARERRDEKARIDALVAEVLPAVRDLRREPAPAPELGYREKRTAARIARELSGCEGWK